MSNDDTMKQIHNNWNELFHDCMMIIFVCGTIGMAIKFVTFFNQWVYFPSFPNALDSTFLVSAVLYLAWNSRKRK
jgi:nicotinamide riboside transporter PnuC